MTIPKRLDMRNLPPRQVLPDGLKKYLLKKTDEILKLPDGESRKQAAKQKYKSSRTTKSFKLVLSWLRGLCGKVEVCMYCSRNKPSHLDHYRPQSVFPELAFDSDNFLWSCDICNCINKGHRFPPDTETGELILNPIDDNVWDYFFLEKGILIPLLSSNREDYMPRAVSTCAVVRINSDDLQLSRNRRYKSISKALARALIEFQQGKNSVEALRDEVDEIRSDAFQADVADYFLNGPGRVDEPFRSALIAIGEEVETEV